MGLSDQCFVLSLLMGYKTVPDEDPGLPRTSIQLRASNKTKTETKINKKTQNQTKKIQPKPKLSQLCPFKVNTKKALVKLTEGDDLLM